MSMSEASRTNRERWRRVEQIYAEAVEREGDARSDTGGARLRK